LQYADVPATDAVPRQEIVALREELRRTGERALAVDGTHNPFLLPNLTRPWDVPVAGGSGPLGIRRYVELIRMGGPGDIAVDTLLDPNVALDLFSVRYALVPDHTDIGARLLAQTGRWAPASSLQFDPDDPDSRYTLYRRNQVRPRASCVGHVARLSEAQTVDAIRTARLPDGSVFDPATTVLAEPDQPLAWAGDANLAEDSVQVVASPGWRSFHVSTPAPCVLVVGNVFYPWWRAAVDGAAAPVARVNATMLGVVLPAGTHSVTLTLQPTSVWLGGMGTGIAALAWLWLAATARRDTISAGATGGR
jgi:hypothetical protein